LSFMETPFGEMNLEAVYRVSGG